MKQSTELKLFGTFILVSLIYVYFFKEDYRKKIKEKGHELAIGRITRTSSNYRNAGSYIDYSYEFGGKTMEGSRNIRDVLYSPERVVDKYFPVLVSKEDPGESAILITPQDFSFFNKAFPDSLNWVVQWVK